MAYQNVSIPRFYINALEWLAENNVITLPSDHYRTLPVNPTVFSTISITPAISVLSDQSFVALLGHNGNSVPFAYYVPDWAGPIGVINAVPGSVPQYDGFSIARFNGEAITNPVLSANPWDTSIGSVVIGTYYDLPNAPNLSLTMSREYGGTKEFTTHNGSSISNTMWSKPPKWGDRGAWELGSDTTYQNLAKSGRRTWQLTFSYLDDGDLWGANQSLSHHYETSTGIETGDLSPTSVAAQLQAGLNWNDGSHWCDMNSDNYCWTDNSGTFANTNALMTGTSFVDTYPEFSDGAGGSNIVGIQSNGGLYYFNGSNTPTLAGNATDRLIPGYYYLITLLDGTTAFSTEAFHRIYSGPAGFQNNLLTDKNFFSQVWHKTLGGTLPFIFQPDRDNNNPDQFAICRFKDNSLQATQSAFNVYDISVTIEEAW